MLSGPDGGDMLTPHATSREHPEAVITGSSEEIRLVDKYPIRDKTGLQFSGFQAADNKLDEVMGLLSPLRLRAEAAAPCFCITALANPIASSVFSNPSSQDIKHITIELQQWFEDLFTPHNIGDHDRSIKIIESKRNYKHLPLSFLLGNLEIILLVGREVTLFSSQPEIAFRAFILNLSSNLANHQIDVEQHLEFVSDLMLLD
jgi:hypothetical protein